MKTKKKDVVKIIYKISELVRQLTEDDFDELQIMIDGQKEYYNPLKMATTIKQHELAEHNEKMVKVLKELKELVSKNVKAGDK